MVYIFLSRNPNAVTYIVAFPSFFFRYSFCPTWRRHPHVSKPTFQATTSRPRSRRRLLVRNPQCLSVSLPPPLFPAGRKPEQGAADTGEPVSGAVRAEGGDASVQPGGTPGVSARRRVARRARSGHPRVRPGNARFRSTGMHITSNCAFVPVVCTPGGVSP